MTAIAEKEKADDATFDGIAQFEGADGLIQRLERDNTKELIKERMTPEKQATYELLEEIVASDAGMIELHLDLKFKMKPWKKALVFGFLFYLIVLLVLIIIITFVKKDFDFGFVSKISTVYMAVLILSFRRMYRMFKEKFSYLA